jgi:hypothetical protein
MVHNHPVVVGFRVCLEISYLDSSVGEGAINHILMRINRIHKLGPVDQMMGRLEGLISSISVVDLGVLHLGRLMVVVVREEVWGHLDQSLRLEIKEEGSMREFNHLVERRKLNGGGSFLDFHLPRLNMDRVMVELSEIHRRKDRCNHLISYVSHCLDWLTDLVQSVDGYTERRRSDARSSRPYEYRRLRGYRT